MVEGLSGPTFFWGSESPSGCSKRTVRGVGNSRESRELGVTALRTIALSEGVVMAAGQGGKEKTALQMVAILLLIVYHPYQINFGFTTLWVDMGQVGLAMLYLSLFFAITSAGEYIKLFVEAVEAKEHRLAEESEAEE